MVGNSLPGSTAHGWQPPPRLFFRPPGTYGQCADARGWSAALRRPGLAPPTAPDSSHSCRDTRTTRPAEVVAAVPADLPADTGFKKRQLAPEFPELAEALREHDVLCLWRRSPGGPVHVHLLPRAEDRGSPLTRPGPRFDPDGRLTAK